MWPFTKRETGQEKLDRVLKSVVQHKVGVNAKGRPIAAHAQRHPDAKPPGGGDEAGKWKGFLRDTPGAVAHEIHHGVGYHAGPDRGKFVDEHGGSDDLPATLRRSRDAAHKHADVGSKRTFQDSQHLREGGNLTGHIADLVEHDPEGFRQFNNTPHGKTLAALHHHIAGTYRPGGYDKDPAKLDAKQEATGREALEALIDHMHGRRARKSVMATEAGDGLDAATYTGGRALGRESLSPRRKKRRCKAKDKLKAALAEMRTDGGDA